MWIIPVFGCSRWLCFFFEQKTAYEMRISDWSSDVCSSDLGEAFLIAREHEHPGEVDRQRERMARPRADIGDEREQRVAQPRHRPPVRTDDLKQDLPARPVRLAVAPHRIGDAKPRSEESRVGKECVSTFSSRG